MAKKLKKKLFCPKQIDNLIFFYLLLILFDFFFTKICFHLGSGPWARIFSSRTTMTLWAYCCWYCCWTWSTRPENCFVAISHWHFHHCRCWGWLEHIDGAPFLVLPRCQFVRCVPIVLFFAVEKINTRYEELLKKNKRIWWRRATTPSFFFTAP